MKGKFYWYLIANELNHVLMVNVEPTYISFSVVRHCGMGNLLSFKDDIKFYIE